jgi:hypothetical protein
MAMKWLKFKCENCNEENWMHEDINTIIKQRSIAYCFKCGFVKGQPSKERYIDAQSSWLECIKLNSIAVKQTRGPVTPGDTMTSETRWGTADGTGGEGLSRVEYMKTYNYDAWTQWCSRGENADKKICQNDGFGRSYKDRYKMSKRPVEEADPSGGP